MILRFESKARNNNMNARGHAWQRTSGNMNADEGYFCDGFDTKLQLFQAGSIILLTLLLILVLSNFLGVTPVLRVLPTSYFLFMDLVFSFTRIIIPRTARRCTHPRA